MRVSKFGGSSLGDFDHMKNSAMRLIEYPSQIVVLSAMSGVTDELKDIAHKNDVERRLFNLQQKHLDVFFEIKEHYPHYEHLFSLEKELRQILKNLQDLALENQESSEHEALLQSHGEKLSSLLFFHLYQALGKSSMPCELVDSSEFIITSSEDFLKAELRPRRSKDKVKEYIHTHPQYQLNTMITQGYIGATSLGKTTLLGRGGSDYSAAILAYLFEASELIIWTDTSFLYEFDPRLASKVREPKAFPLISADSARYMSRFGAKVLHPKTLDFIHDDLKVFIAHSQKEYSLGTEIIKKANRHHESFHLLKNVSRIKIKLKESHASPILKALCDLRLLYFQAQMNDVEIICEQEERNFVLSKLEDLYEQQTFDYDERVFDLITILNPRDLTHYQKIQQDSYLTYLRPNHVHYLLQDGELHIIDLIKDLS